PDLCQRRRAFPRTDSVRLSRLDLRTRRKSHRCPPRTRRLLPRRLSPQSRSCRRLGRTHLYQSWLRPAPLASQLEDLTQKFQNWQMADLRTHQRIEYGRPFSNYFPDGCLSIAAPEDVTLDRTPRNPRCSKCPERTHGSTFALS